MKITQVELNRTINLGNYSNIKLGAVAEVGGDEDPAAAMMELSRWLTDVANKAKQTCVQETKGN